MFDQHLWHLAKGLIKLDIPNFLRSYGVQHTISCSVLAEESSLWLSERRLKKKKGTQRHPPREVGRGCSSEEDAPGKSIEPHPEKLTLLHWKSTSAWDPQKWNSLFLLIAIKPTAQRGWECRMKVFLPIPFFYHEVLPLPPEYDNGKKRLKPQTHLPGGPSLP